MEEVDLVFLRKSQEFLERHVATSPEKPFFLYHCTQAVHLPSFAAKQFQGKSGAGPHGDFIHELDAIVGELLSTLERLGVAENTIVIFTSDNGPEVASVVNMRKAHEHDGARPWRGIKRDQWEGGHRVPFLVRWPGQIPANSVSMQLTSLTDITATVAAISKIEIPKDAAEDSFDLFPAWLDPTHPQIRPYLLTQAFGGIRTLSIRKGDWKYIDHSGSGGNRYEADASLKAFEIPDDHPDAKGQLYDLASDPGERNNLFETFPERVAELKGLLEKSKVSGRSR
jgi:arylsulfatase A-like enzyme